MNTNQIDYFLVVAELENISEASRRLYVSQPVLSRMIASLERELDIALFEKNGRNIKLTSFGSELYDLLSRHKNEFRQLINKHQHIEKDKPVRMIIAYPFSWSIMPVISGLIDSFEAEYPNVLLSFRTQNFTEMNQGIKNGQFDVLLTLASAAPDNLQFDVTDLCELKSYILYSDNHPVGKLDHDPVLADFYGSTLYYLPSSDVQDMDKILDNLFAPLDLDLKLKMQQSWQTCVANVLLGRGILLTDEWSAEQSQKDFRALEFPQPHTLVMVSNTGNPYTTELKEHLLQSIRKRNNHR